MSRLWELGILDTGYDGLPPWYITIWLIMFAHGFTSTLDRLVFSSWMDGIPSRRRRMNDRVLCTFFSRLSLGTRDRLPKGRPRDGWHPSTPRIIETHSLRTAPKTLRDDYVMD